MMVVQNSSSDAVPSRVIGVEVRNDNGLQEEMQEDELQVQEEMEMEMEMQEDVKEEMEMQEDELHAIDGIACE